VTGFLSYTWKKGMPHREAKNNMDLLGFPLNLFQSITVRSYPFCPITLLYGCSFFIDDFTGVIESLREVPEKVEVLILALRSLSMSKE
jgi:hypothetical protein